MLMNSVPNSDSEQCTESKLSRVHSAPTLGPACTHTALCCRPSLAMSQAWPGRVVAHAWPCCALCRRVPSRAAAHRIASLPGCVAHGSRHNAMSLMDRDTTPCRSWIATQRRVAHGSRHNAVSLIDRDTTPCRRPLPITIQILYRELALPRVSQPPTPYRGALLRRIAVLAALHHHTTVAPHPRYNVLYRDFPWPGHARARCRKPGAQAGRVVACVMACIMALPHRVVGVAWPYRGPCCLSMPPAALPVSSYSALYRDQVQNGQ